MVVRRLTTTLGVITAARRSDQRRTSTNSGEALQQRQGGARRRACGGRKGQGRTVGPQRRWWKARVADRRRLGVGAGARPLGAPPAAGRSCFFLFLLLIVLFCFCFRFLLSFFVLRSSFFVLRCSCSCSCSCSCYCSSPATCRLSIVAAAHRSISPASSRASSRLGRHPLSFIVPSCGGRGGVGG